MFLDAVARWDLLPGSGRRRNRQLHSRDQWEDLHFHVVSLHQSWRHPQWRSREGPPLMRNREDYRLRVTELAKAGLWPKRNSRRNHHGRGRLVHIDSSIAEIWIPTDGTQI